jgi:hypothetical protein
MGSGNGGNAFSQDFGITVVNCEDGMPVSPSKPRANLLSMLIRFPEKESIRKAGKQEG